MTDDRKLPDELVERAAKALRGNAQPAWESTTPDWRAYWRGKALAALEAALSEGGEVVEATDKYFGVAKHPIPSKE